MSESRLKELGKVYVPQLGTTLDKASIKDIDAIVDALKMDKKLHQQVKEYLDLPPIKDEMRRMGLL